MKYNKGEWSEAYAFIKLIGESKVYAADENLNKIENKFYLILKVFKDEIEKYYENDTKNGIVNIIDYKGNIVSSLNSDLFIDVSKEALNIMNNNERGSFEIPVLKDFLNQIGIEKFKSSSNKKEDIKMEILDWFINQGKILNFSIKSEIGNKPTILNASKSTNFLFRLDGISDDEVDYLNGITKETDKNWIKTKFNNIFEGFEDGIYTVSLVDNDSVFYQNLRLIDSNLPHILAYLLFYFYSHKSIGDIVSLTEELMKYNPLNLKERKEYFYEKKICDFIKAVSFGMMPNKRWNGEYEISGGLLTVKKDGDILCHHIFYDSQSLAKYLYKNTKLETPSTSRHEFANIFKDNIGNYFFKLNLQLRFK